jgi:hypothetical protein
MSGRRGPATRPEPVRGILRTISDAFGAGQGRAVHLSVRLSLEQRDCFSLHCAEGGVHAAAISSRRSGFPHGGRSCASLPQPAAAQNAFVGIWNLVPDSISGHIPGLPAASELEIDLSGAELLLTLHPIPMLRSDVSKEAYRLDGSETNLSGYRKAKLAVTDSTMTVTTVRIRPGSEQVLIVSDVYRASENILTVT